MDVHQNTQRGSALFIILIAVMLFAALSYAVSNMMRGGNEGLITEEKSNLYADEILEYARQIGQSIHGLRISNDCTDTEISFENAALAGYTHTPAAPDACQVFNVSGGGMSYLPATSVINGGLDWIFTGENDGANVGTQCNADGCADLIVILPDIKLTVCQAINKKLGIATAASYLTQEDDSFSVTKFQGAYNYTARIEDSAGLAELDGKMQGCLEGKNAPQSTGKYYFYQVLIPR